MIEEGGALRPSTRGPSPFGHLLLRHRRHLGLTQEDLAGRSGVSVRALSNLERGRAGAAQRRSATALADALGLTGGQRDEFLATARDGRRRPAAAPEHAPPPAALCALPVRVPDFVGREAELEQVTAWADQLRDSPGGAVISVVGPPGTGKTTLAVAAAHRLAAGFPDGRFAVDLRGLDEHPLWPVQALDRLLRATGLDTDQIPGSVDELSSLFRSTLARRRVLLLLDNAVDEAQVRPLLAAGPGCLTIVTSRRSLTGLEGGRWLWLSPLTTTESLDLLTEIAGPERVRAEPEAARLLAERCGHLPLALRIAGNRLARHPHWSIADLTALLQDRRTRLTALTAGDLQVRSAFAVSYQQLSAPARQMFARLALLPGGDFGYELAAVAAGTSRAEALSRIEELVDATLVHPAPVPARFQFHDLIRIFAAEQLDLETDPRERAADAVHTYLLATATAAGRRFDPYQPGDGAGGAAGPVAAAPNAAGQGDRNGPGGRRGPGEQDAEWLEREASHWLAAAHDAVAAGRHRELIALARAMHWFSDAHQCYPWADLFGWGIAAARAVGDRHAEAALLNFLGWAQGIANGDLHERLDIHRQALVIAVEAGDRLEEAWALTYLGSVLARLERPAEGLEQVQRATTLLVGLGHWLALNSARNVQGKLLRLVGRHSEALAAHRAVLDDLLSRADIDPGLRRYHQAFTLTLVGEVLLDLRDWHRAATTFHHARCLITSAQVPGLAGHCAYHEGLARLRGGEHAAAVECLRAALEGFTDPTTHPWRARALTELAEALQATGADQEASAYRQEALTLYAEQAGSQPPLRAAPRSA